MFDAPTQTPTPTATPFACCGDCDGDGMVTNEDVRKCTDIVLGNADVQTCVACDCNHDGVLTTDEFVTVVNNAVGGCPSPALPTPTPTSTATPGGTPPGPAPVQINVGSGSPDATGKVQIDVTLITGGYPVGGEQNDIVFDNTIVQLNSAADCRINPALGTAQDGCHADPPTAPCKTLQTDLRQCGGLPQAPGCPAGAAGHISRLRAILAATVILNANTIPDGVLYTCTFTVVVATRLPTALENRNLICAPSLDPLSCPVTGSDGLILGQGTPLPTESTKTAIPTATNTATPVGTATATRLATPLPPTATPTATSARMAGTDSDGCSVAPIEHHGALIFVLSLPAILLSWRRIPKRSLTTSRQQRHRIWQ